MDVTTMRDGLYQVTHGPICAGFTVDNGRVTMCAPILRKRGMAGQVRRIGTFYRILLTGSRLYGARPKVVHLKHDQFDIRIDRATKWGNPFRLGSDGSRDNVIKLYKEWLLNQPGLLSSLGELRGKILGCWCAPEDCHGDVLAEHVVERDRAAVRRNLLAVQSKWGCRPDQIVVVHGAARGLDSIASEIATELGMRVEAHPVTSADWNRYGKSAGHRRNAVMIASVTRRAAAGRGVIAYPVGASPGTRGCMVMAVAAGLVVWNRTDTPSRLP